MSEISFIKVPRDDVSYPPYYSVYKSGYNDCVGFLDSALYTPNKNQIFASYVFEVKNRHVDWSASDLRAIADFMDKLEKEK